VKKEERRRENGEGDGRREKGEGRREKGEGRRETGEGRRAKEGEVTLFDGKLIKLATPRFSSNFPVSSKLNFSME
jgi:hypothetical protein